MILALSGGPVVLCLASGVLCLASGVMLSGVWLFGVEHWLVRFARFARFRASCDCLVLGHRAVFAKVLMDVWTSVFSPHVYSSPASPVSPPVTLRVAHAGSNEEEGAPGRHPFKIPQHVRRQAASAVHARKGAANKRLQFGQSATGGEKCTVSSAGAIPRDHLAGGATPRGPGQQTSVWLDGRRASLIEMRAPLRNLPQGHAAATHQLVMELHLLAHRCPVSPGLWVA